MINEEKAFKDAIRADERKRIAKEGAALVKRAMAMVESAQALLKAVAKFVEPDSATPIVNGPAPARKPRTAKLDEGVVNAVIGAITTHGQDKVTIEAISKVGGRQLGNYLVALEKRGEIVKLGKGKDATYMLASVKEVANGSTTQSPT